MTDFRVVIPSRTPVNLNACLAQIILHEPDFDPKKIIVIDDGLGDGAPSWVTVVPGIKPFNFSRNVNLGINLALQQGADVVILLNDDAMLLERGGFRKLAELAVGRKAVTSSAIQGIVCNPKQKIENMYGPVQERSMVAFIAVALPRTVIEKVGLLDERFDYDGYGSEDNDYCVRCVEAKVPIWITSGCVVDHSGRLTRSTYRSNENWRGLMAVNRARFHEKYSFANAAD